MYWSTCYIRTGICIVYFNNYGQSLVWQKKTNSQHQPLIAADTLNKKNGERKAAGPDPPDNSYCTLGPSKVMVYNHIQVIILQQRESKRRLILFFPTWAREIRYGDRGCMQE